jgi:hypothetical protein
MNPANVPRRGAVDAYRKIRVLIAWVQSSANALNS